MINQKQYRDAAPLNGFTATISRASPSPPTARPHHEGDKLHRIGSIFISNLRQKINSFPKKKKAKRSFIVASHETRRNVGECGYHFATLSQTS